jgi:hypothetical protein
MENTDKMLIHINKIIENSSTVIEAETKIWAQGPDSFWLTAPEMTLNIARLEETNDSEREIEDNTLQTIVLIDQVTQQLSVMREKMFHMWQRVQVRNHDKLSLTESCGGAEDYVVEETPDGGFDIEVFDQQQRDDWFNFDVEVFDRQNPDDWFDEELFDLFLSNLQ